MIENFYTNSQDEFDFHHKPLTISEMVKFAFGIEPDSLSEYERQTIARKQCYFALNSTLFIQTLAIIVSISLWIYINYMGKENDYVNYWGIGICVAYIWLAGVWYYNFMNLKRDSNCAKTFFVSNAPGAILGGICLGLLPIIADMSLEIDSYIGITFYMALLTIATAWAFPFHNLTFILIISMSLSFSFFHYNFHPHRHFVFYGLFIFYPMALLYISYACFNLFIRNILGRIKYSQKSKLVSLFLKDIEDSATDWLWQTNAQGYFSYTSDKFFEITGFSVGYLKHIKAIDLFDKNNTEARQLTKIIENKQHFINYKIPITLQGSKVFWSITGHPKYSNRGDFLGYRGVGTDITKVHLLEVAAEEKKRYESFSQISASLSHDFNNLLASISLRLELIRTSQELQPQNKTYAAEALDVCKKFAKITSQMLIYSRKEALEPKNISIDNVLNLAIAEIKANKKNTIKFIIRGNDHFIWLDEALFYNTLVNIFNNALRAMNKDGVIYIEKSLITINKARLDLAQGDYIYLVVEDTGPGFDHESLNQAFEPFYTQNRNAGGSGLGLSMAQGFVKQSKGSIAISNGEHGAKIELYLPKGTSSNLKSHENYDKKTIQKYHIVLLVEDNEDFGFLLKAHLQSNALHVFYATSVEHAKELLDSHPDISFVISDFYLGDGTGADVIRYARQLNENIKALYISGFLSKPLDSAIEKAPVLKKPFSLDDLSVAINNQH